MISAHYHVIFWLQTDHKSKLVPSSLHDSCADVVVHDVEAEVSGAAPPHQHLAPVRVVVTGSPAHRTGVESCDKRVKVRKDGSTEFYTAKFVIYSVTITSRTWVKLTFILAVPLSARFCLGWWEIGRIGRAAGQVEWNIKIKVNPTQVWDVMGHPIHNSYTNVVKLGEIWFQIRLTLLMNSSFYRTLFSQMALHLARAMDRLNSFLVAWD